MSTILSISVISKRSWASPTELTKNDPAGKLKVASLEKGLANAMKNYQGECGWYEKNTFPAEKAGF